MNKLTALIAAIGTNAYWIAFNAHFWFAAFITKEFHNAWVLGGCFAAAALKEFVFDAKNEVPKQTAFDNWTDFAGYACGALIGYFVA